ARRRHAAALHRSSRWGRPRPLRTGHPPPQTPKAGLRAGGLLARGEVPSSERGHRCREGGVVPVSKEIVDAVRGLEQEKGISADKLMDALEDALLSAY